MAQEEHPAEAASELRTAAEKDKKHQADAKAASKLQAVADTMPLMAPQVKISSQRSIDAADNLPI